MQNQRAYNGNKHNENRKWNVEHKNIKMEEEWHKKR